MSRRERISIHSKGTECEDGHGNNAAYGGGKKKGFERVKHWSVGIGRLRQPNLNQLNKLQLLTSTICGLFLILILFLISICPVNFCLNSFVFNSYFLYFKNALKDS